MSRIGKQPVAIPSGVTVTVQGRDVKVKGPKGEVDSRLPVEISARVDDGHVVVERVGEGSRDKAMHGLARSLVANAVEGVTASHAAEHPTVTVSTDALLDGVEHAAH